MLVRIVRRFFAKIRISRAQKQFLFAFCRGDEVKDTKRWTLSQTWLSLSDSYLKNKDSESREKTGICSCFPRRSLFNRGYVKDNNISKNGSNRFWMVVNPFRQPFERFSCTRDGCCGPLTALRSLPGRLPRRSLCRRGRAGRRSCPYWIFCSVLRRGSSRLRVPVRRRIRL